jgi:guanylate kinase
MSKRGLLLVVSAPSGTGKDTVARRLLEKEPNLVKSISATTRSPREGEADGKDYFFLTTEAFEELARRDGLMERAVYNGNQYGTPRDYADRMRSEGRDVVLVIDVAWGLNLKRMGEDAVYICILPPSLDELRRRLICRGTEDDKVIQQRLDWTGEELNKLVHYDYLVVNDDIDRAAEAIRTILGASRMAMKRNMDIMEDIRGGIAK